MTRYFVEEDAFDEHGSDAAAASSTQSVRKHGAHGAHGARIYSYAGKHRNGAGILGLEAIPAILEWQGTRNREEIAFAVKTESTSCESRFKFPSPVLFAQCAEIAAQHKALLFALCEDGWVYALAFRVYPSLEVERDESDLRYAFVGQNAKDQPTALGCSGDGVFVGRSSGNITVLTLEKDFCVETDPVVAEFREIKEPLMKRIFGGLTSQDKSIIGVHFLAPHASGAILVVHASGMMRLWQGHPSKGFLLQGENQVPTIEEEDAIEMTASSVTCFQASASQTTASTRVWTGGLATITFTNPRKATVGLVVMQVAYDAAQGHFGLENYGVVNISSEYSQIRSVCGASPTLVCLVLQTLSGESCVKTAEVAANGSVVLRDVRERCATLLDWIPLEASSDFNPQALLPWMAEGEKKEAEACKVETYVRKRLLDRSSVDAAALRSALNEIGGEDSSASAGPSSSADEDTSRLFPLIEGAMANLAHQAGVATPKVQHWLHFLRLYARFWKQRRAAVCVGSVEGPQGERMLVITRTNGSLGMLRPADDLEIFKHWADFSVRGKNPGLEGMGEAMRCAEDLVGPWNKGLCVHLVLQGESPAMVARALGERALQAKLVGAGVTSGTKDETERARVAQRLKERRLAVFRLVSAIQDIPGPLEEAIASCLGLLSLSPPMASGGDTMDTGAKDSGGGVLGGSLGSILGSLTLVRLDTFVVFLTTLHLYSFASQGDVYTAMRLVTPFSSLDLASIKVVHTISSERAVLGPRASASVTTRMIRLLPGSKTRKTSAAEASSVPVLPSLASTMAASKLWEWGRPRGASLLAQAFAFCDSFRVERSDDPVAALSAMILRTTLCLYALGQTRVIHQVLDGCGSAISHTSEFTFVRGLGFCAQSVTSAGAARAAEEAFFAAVSGISSSSADLRARIHQLKHSLQGTSASRGFGAQNGAALGLTRLDYYKFITLLFRRANNLRGAVMFTLAAIAETKARMASQANGGPMQEEGKLWTTLFELFLDLKMWREAYVTIIANPLASSSIAALHTLVITLFEAKEVSCLCDLPLVGCRAPQEEEGSSEAAAKTPAFYLAEAESALVWHCDHISIDNGTNPYLPLFSFYTKLHKHRKAAGVMVRYVRRLETGEAASISAVDMRAHYRALLVAHNSLSLLQERFRSVEDPEFAPHAVAARVAEGRDGKRGLVTLSDIKCDLLTSRARLLCAEASADFAPATIFFHKSAVEVSEILAKHGKFGAVLDLAAALPESRRRERDSVVTMAAMELAKHCVSPAAHSLDAVMAESGPSAHHFVESSSDTSHAWAQLKALLARFDDRRCNFRLRVVVADTLLTEKRNICMPQWLLDSFKSDLSHFESFRGHSDLLNVLIKHGLLADACNVAIEMIGTWKVVLADPRARHKPGAMWFPYNVLDTLATKLEARHQDGRLTEMRANLERALQQHFASMREESLMVAQ